jgi:hypothetical protein
MLSAGLCPVKIPRPKASTMDVAIALKNKKLFRPGMPVRRKRRARPHPDNRSAESTRLFPEKRLELYALCPLHPISFTGKYRIYAFGLILVVRDRLTFRSATRQLLAKMRAGFLFVAD